MDQSKTTKLITLLQDAAKNQNSDHARDLLNMASGAIIAYREWIAKQLYDRSCIILSGQHLPWGDVINKNQWRLQAERAVSEMFPTTDDYLKN